MSNTKQKRKAQPLDGKGLGVGSGDPDGYHAWLIGKGYAPAKAMRMVAEKFGQIDEPNEPKLGWAWKD